MNLVTQPIYEVFFQTFGDNAINRALINLMKSAAVIHENQHELTADCNYQIKIAVNVLGNIIKRNQEVL